MIDALVSGKLIEDTEQVRLVSLDTRGRVRERKVGEILAVMEMAKGGRPNKEELTPPKIVGVNEDRQTLADMGITKNESSEWQ